jgi:hypothetical protein
MKGTQTVCSPTIQACLAPVIITQQDGATAVVFNKQTTVSLI